MHFFPPLDIHNELREKKLCSYGISLLVQGPQHPFVRHNTLCKIIWSHYNQIHPEKIWTVHGYPWCILVKSEVELEFLNFFKLKTYTYLRLHYGFQNHSSSEGWH